MKTELSGAGPALVVFVVGACLTGCAGGRTAPDDVAPVPETVPVPSYPDGQVFRDCGACPEVVVIPSGRFVMGSPQSEDGHAEYEGPQREIEVPSQFAVGVYEVTFDEWEACVDAGRCGGRRPEDAGWGRGRRPVINVSWEDARAYLEWLSEQAGYRYRLPSEAEWEYVARARTVTARHWGETPSDQCSYANGVDAEAPCPDGYSRTAPVGSFRPNRFGLYDSMGNVWEWTQDCWNGNYPSTSGDTRAVTSGDCSLRVVRGGSAFDGPANLRSASRASFPAVSRQGRVGFRVVRILD